MPRQQRPTDRASSRVGGCHRPPGRVRLVSAEPDRSLGAGAGRSPGEFLLVGGEVTDCDVGVAVLLAEKEDVGRDNVAQGVALTHVLVDVDAHFPRSRSGPWTGQVAASASSRSCQRATTAATESPRLLPGLKVAG